MEFGRNQKSIRFYKFSFLVRVVEALCRVVFLAKGKNALFALPIFPIVSIIGRDSFGVAIEGTISIVCCEGKILDAILVSLPEIGCVEFELLRHVTQQHASISLLRKDDDSAAKKF